VGRYWLAEPLEGASPLAPSLQSEIEPVWRLGGQFSNFNDGRRGPQPPKSRMNAAIVRPLLRFPNFGLDWRSSSAFLRGLCVRRSLWAGKKQRARTPVLHCPVHRSSFAVHRWRFVVRRSMFGIRILVPEILPSHTDPDTDYCSRALRASESISCLLNNRISPGPRSRTVSGPIRVRCKRLTL
jgi:hypothetical protein